MEALADEQLSVDGLVCLVLGLAGVALVDCVDAGWWRVVLGVVVDAKSAEEEHF